MLFLVRGWDAKSIEKKKKTDRRKMKRKKNEKYREGKITKVNIFGFTFYIKVISCSKT